MQVDDFYRSRQADWTALSTLLDRSHGGIRHLSPKDVESLGHLYRAATSDLALAQRDFPRHPVTTYLNQLVARAHAVVYRGDPIAYKRLLRFATTGFPRAYREALPFILVAMLLMLLPALVVGISTAWQPETARWMLPAEVQALIPQIENRDLWTKIPLAERPGTSSFVIRNNLQVAFFAFSGGVLLALPSAYVLILNGLILGGITGLTAHYGIGFELWTFVIGHGVIELSVILIAGGSGLMMGWALLSPGLFSRRDALTLAARRAVRLVVGCVPLLFIAGTIEGLLSPAENVPWPAKWAVGLGSGVLLYCYLLLAGRDR